MKRYTIVIILYFTKKFVVLLNHHTSKYIFRHDQLVFIFKFLGINV